MKKQKLLVYKAKQQKNTNWVSWTQKKPLPPETYYANGFMEAQHCDYSYQLTAVDCVRR